MKRDRYAFRSEQIFLNQRKIPTFSKGFKTITKKGIYQGLMGGFGSTRWSFHNKKITVEDSHKITIYYLKPYLIPGSRGYLTWGCGERQTGSMAYQVIDTGIPETIRFTYTMTDLRTGEKMDLDYSVRLQTTTTVWGSERYWFTCPLIVDGSSCARRVGALYLPPGGMYFGCRHCYNLTYQSTQESKKWDSFYASMAAAMHDNHPHMTGADFKYLLENKGKPPEGFYRRLSKDDWADYPDPYAQYLSADELRRQAGLTSINFAHLEAARLLLPDHDGKYRPKLVGWGRKLAFLLDQGWEIDEIKHWSQSRWTTPDPRQWPPERERR
jgi:hypothetical protein